MKNSENMASVIRYTTAISKGAGMVNETRKLLESWDPSESLESFVKRVQEEDLLGHATAYRTRDAVLRVFAPRFLRPTDKPARILKQIVKSGLPPNTFTEMLFVYSCRNDPLIYDFTIREFWVAVRRGKTVLNTDTAVAFLSEATYDGHLNPPWSDNVQVRIARCVLGILRDVGFLRERQRGRKEIVDYRMTDEGLAILARDLHESGITDAAICEHPDWGLFGLNRAGVLERLDALGEDRGLIVQRAGSVIRFTWLVESMEELIDVLAR